MTKQNDLTSIFEDIAGERKARLTSHEEEDLIGRRLENQLKDEKLKGVVQDREARKEFADRLFNFLKWFLLIVLLIVLLNGFCFTFFEISDAALVALLTTTTANIIGIFAFVVRYLFHAK